MPKYKLVWTAHLLVKPEEREDGANDRIQTFSDVVAFESMPWAARAIELVKEQLNTAVLKYLTELEKEKGNVVTTE